MSEMDSPAERQPDPLWDPKYAAVGVLAIALVVAVLDLLPRFVASKLRESPSPPERKAAGNDLLLLG